MKDKVISKKQIIKKFIALLTFVFIVIHWFTEFDILFLILFLIFIFYLIDKS